MIYADYQFYTDEYYGVMPEIDFPRYALRASAYLDYITDGRSKTYADDAEKLKFACCAVADAYKLNDEGGPTTSLSFNTDGYSENRSYAAGITNTKNEDKRLYDAAKIYLADTGLLSRVLRSCARWR